MSDQKTAGQRVAEDVRGRFRARSTLLWVITPEERRAELSICEIAAACKFAPRLWDCLQGVTSIGEDPTKDESGRELSGVKSAQAEKVLAEIARSTEQCAWILRDFPPYLSAPGVRRGLRALAKQLQTPRIVDVPGGGKRSVSNVVIVLSTSEEVHPDLRDLAQVVRWPLPDRVEIAQLLDLIVENLPEDRRAGAAPNGVREAAIEAALGLSQQQAKDAFQRSLVTHGAKIVPSSIAEEKRRIVSEVKGLEWREADGRGLDAIGGLDLEKAWLRQRRKGFTARAREYGLPASKGILLVGPPGTGKSLAAEATAAAWGFPLIRFDLGAMKAGVVGSSEANLRRGLAIVEAVGNCVVWIDEIEKALSGAQGALDGGVSGDQLGTLLQWMQDRRGGAFVVATVNRIQQLPAELTRSGRFDAIFFVDLPTAAERAEIVRVTVRKFGRDPAGFDLARIAEASEGYTGADLRTAFESALFSAFDDGERAVETADVLAALADIVPQSRGNKAEIDGMREWAKGRARPASSPEVQGEKSAAALQGIPVLDLSEGN